MAESQLPKLLVSQEQAEEEIKAQIFRGHRILEDVAPSQTGLGFGRHAALDVAKTEGTKWAKFTIDLLKTLLTGLSIDREFGSSDIRNYGGDPSIEFLEWMYQRLNGLDSILERLPLFSLSVKPVHTEAAPAPSKQQSKNIFIVHGHDEAAKQEVARVIEKLELHAIILHEQPDKGRIIIEKFEHHSDVGFAVVLLTPDDMGYPKDTPSEVKPRARQNVVLELGYFIGILGRSNVCPLLKGDVEIPNDYAGVLYKKMDASGAWRFELAREIKGAGIDVDLNRLK